MKTTEQAKHTAGPWRVGGSHDWNIMGNRGDTRVGVPRPTLIASAHFGGYTANAAERDEVSANARLIAAAPELLEACIGLLANSPAPKGIRKDFSYILYREAAREAIRKATGSE